MKAAKEPKTRIAVRKYVNRKIEGFIGEYEAELFKDVGEVLNKGSSSSSTEGEYVVVSILK